jgi:hypothetical protein
MMIGNTRMVRLRMGVLLLMGHLRRQELSGSAPVFRVLRGGGEIGARFPCGKCEQPDRSCMKRNYRPRWTARPGNLIGRP